MWPVSRRLSPSPRPRRWPTAFGRPSSTICRSVSSPTPRMRCTRYFAISASRPVGLEMSTIAASVSRTASAVTCTAALEKSGWFIARRSLQGHHRGDVDLDHHARPGELVDVEQRMRRHRSGAEHLAAAGGVERLGADVGEIGDDLHRVGERRAVLLERPLDLVIGIFALTDEVVLVPDDAGGCAFILGADAGEEDHLPRTGHGDGLGETALVHSL